MIWNSDLESYMEIVWISKSLSRLIVQVKIGSSPIYLNYNSDALWVNENVSKNSGFYPKVRKVEFRYHNQVRIV